MQKLGKTAELTTAFEHPDPHGIADRMLAIADALFASRGQLRGRDERPSLEDYWRGEGLTNLALNRPCRQSSLYPHSPSVNADADASQGVSGFLTGSYQFSTKDEHGPWWCVDLENVRDIKKVLIFNRVEAGTSRASRFSLLLSADGTQWDEVFEKTDDAEIGGIDGSPFTWPPEAPISARFVRIRMNTLDLMHLDQVAVLG
jgi:hypothetical protein